MPVDSIPFTPDAPAAIPFTPDPVAAIPFTPDSPAATVASARMGATKAFTPDQGRTVASLLTSPVHPLQRASPEPGDSAFRTTLKSLYNAKQGLGEMVETPINLLAGGVAKAVPVLAKPIAALFAASLAKNVPQDVANVKKAYTTGGTQEQQEAGIRAVGDVAGLGLLGHSALEGGAPPQPKLEEVLSQPKPKEANAIRTQQVQESVQTQRGSGDARGETKTSGVGDSLQPQGGEKVVPAAPQAASVAPAQAGRLQPQGEKVDVVELLKKARNGTPEQKAAFKQVRAFAREEGFTPKEFVSAIQSKAIEHPEGEEAISRLSPSNNSATEPNAAATSSDTQSGRSKLVSGILGASSSGETTGKSPEVANAGGGATAETPRSTGQRSPGSKADEFGAIYGPKLTPQEFVKLREKHGEVEDLPDVNGASVKVKVSGSHIIVTASRPVKGSGLTDVGTATLTVQPDGTTILNGSRQGREIDDIAQNSLKSVLGSKPTPAPTVKESLTTQQPTPAPETGKAYYAAGETKTRGGVQYVSETPELAGQYAEGGKFGRPGAKVEKFTGELNTFDATKATPKEREAILGAKNVRQGIEPDGHINFHFYEDDPTINERLKKAGYDSIKVSEGENGVSIAVLDKSKLKLSDLANTGTARENPMSKIGGAQQKPRPVGQFQSLDEIDASKLSPAQKVKARDAFLKSKGVKPPEEQSEPGVKTLPMGPGASNIRELEASGATALKNAAAEMERHGLGLESAPENVRRNMTQAWLQSGEVIERDPQAGAKLATELITNPERGVTDADSALLLRHKVSLLNAINDAAEKTHVGDDASKQQAGLEHERLQAQLQDFLDAVQARGSEWGREGRWRQALASPDYDFTSREGFGRAFKAQTRRDILPREEAAVTQHVDKIKKADAEASQADEKFFEDVKKLSPAKATTAEEGRKIMADHKESQPFTPDQLKALWGRASEYRTESGEKLDNVATKVATDLGLPRKEVIRGLTQNKTTKRLADDAWKKQQDARQLKQAAKRWINQTTLPGYRKALDKIPRALFAAKVGFHGTVALGTHAPMVAFQPQYWKMYVNNYGRMFKMVGDRAYYEQKMQDLVRDPNYIKAKRAGLVNDPWQYEDFNSPDVNAWAKAWSGGGNRGYSVLKLLRQDMFNQQWESLPKTAQVPEVASALADSINHVTGVTKKAAPKGLNTVFFAPRLEGSRVAWLTVDPAKAADTFLRWKSPETTEADKIFAIHQLREKATVAAVMTSLLAADQAFLSATGSKQKINGIPEALGGAGFHPMEPDFMKFKGFGEQLSYGNPFLTMIRLPMRVGSVGFEDNPKFKREYPDATVGKELEEYGRSQLSPFASLGMDVITREDWMNRQLPFSNKPEPKRLLREGIEPYTWKEFILETGLPIPASEALRDVWQTGFGLSDQQLEGMAAGAGKAMFMGVTGARISEDYSLRK